MSQSTFIRRLHILFGEPKCDDLESFVGEYTDALGRYSTAEQDAAATALRDSHRYRSWPTVADCVAACQGVRELAARLKPRPSEATYPEWSKERLALAYRLIKGDLGRQAAREGWILGLWDFVRNHGRLPTGREIADVRASSAESGIAEAAAGLLPQSEAYGALKSMANSLLDRRERLARIALGENA